MGYRLKILVNPALMAAVAIFFLLIGLYSPEVEAMEADKPAIWSSGEEQKPLLVNVTLQRIYLDGEVSEESVVESFQSWEDFWGKYEAWYPVDISRQEVVLRSRIEDISPLLKANGFFGLTGDGVLTIFNGRPPYSQIIQSFFQIDIKKLESRRQKELEKGIRIETKDRFVEVLESFKPFSTSENSGQQ